MTTKYRALGLAIVIIAAFIFGRGTYYWYLSWFLGSNDLLFTTINSGMLANLLNGIYFSLSAFFIFVVLKAFKQIRISVFLSCFLQFLTNITLYTIFIAIHRSYSKLHTLSVGSADIVHSHFLVELLASTFLTIVIMSVLHATFLSSKHKNGIHKGV